jgi:hypothetical protein
MAKGGTIEIDVELQGTQNIETQFKNIGDASKGLASTMGNTNEKLGEGIDSLGESFTGVRDSIGELGAGISNLGKGGAMSFLGLLGPIAGVTTALFTAYETFKLISGAAQEAEQNEQAMAAAASDLQSKLEALAEKGVIPSQKEMEKFTMATIEAQFAKEKLQGRHEKLTKVVRKSYEANKNLREATENLIETEKEGLGVQLLLDLSARQYNNALKEQKDAKEALRVEVRKYLAEQRGLANVLKDAAKQEEGLEEQSVESLKAKNKELIAQKKGLELLKAETKMKESDFKLKKVEIEQNAQLALLKVKDNEENKEALAAQKKKLEDAIKTFKQEELIRKKAAKDQETIRKDIRDKEKADRQKRQAERQRAKLQRDAMLKADIQREKIKVAELAKIRQLEIEGQDDSVQKQIELLTHQYNTSLKLAGDNQRQQQIAALNYYNQLNAITQKEEAKKTRIEQQEAQKRQEFRDMQRDHEIQMIKNDDQRKIEMLKNQLSKELILAGDNEKEMLRAYGRFTDKLNQVDSQAWTQMTERFKDFFNEMRDGIASAAYNAIFFGESFKDATAQILRGLGEQAAVEALMNTAKGIAALTNPFTAAQAPGYFQSAAIFGTAAAVAGASSAAMGAGGGGGVGGGVGVSPSGSPQSVGQAPQREEATASTQVFNINFSGAVVYDTKRAAEEAFADRIMRTMSRNRRGSRRMS